MVHGKIIGNYFSGVDFKTETKTPKRRDPKITPNDSSAGILM